MSKASQAGAVYGREGVRWTRGNGVRDGFHTKFELTATSGVEPTATVCGPPAQVCNSFVSFLLQRVDNDGALTDLERNIWRLA